MSLMSNAAWIIPTAKEAYENREELAGIWHRVMEYLRGKKTSIAVTGLEASGKTVLFDRITGKAATAAYQPPGRSTSMEKGGTRSEGKQLVLSVVPGQHSEPRHVALDEVFENNPVSGVVHVVCNGFNQPRGKVAQEALVQEHGLTTIRQYREYQMKRELDDLDATCEIVRQCARRKQKPAWVIVAVAKADLFEGEMHEAEAYYSEDGRSAFSDKFRALQGQVGADNLQWSARPVCAWLEDFIWNAESVPSMLKSDQSNRMLQSFLRHLEAHCGGR